jgi:hypothetical protein
VKRTRLQLALTLFFLVLLPSTGYAQRVIHRIRFGESLATICKSYYGIETYANLLAAANALDPSRELKPGDHLRIPTAFYYTARQTTSLDQIAATFLGDRRRWTALATFNKVGKKRGIKKGKRVLIPFSLMHLAASTDTFVDLSTRYYGTPRYATLISSYNFINEPKVSPGTTIEVPIGEMVISSLRLEDLVNEQLLGVGSEMDRQKRESLQEANALLRGGEYQSVPLRLIQLLSREVASSTYLAEIYKLLAITYVALDRNELATKAFQEALLHQPSLTLDPVNTSPKVMRIFVDAKNQAQRGGS